MKITTISTEETASLLETHSTVEVTTIPGMLLTRLKTLDGDIVIVQGSGDKSLLICS